jgi:hypothetical protein
MLESLRRVVDIPKELIRMTSDLLILCQKAGLTKPEYLDPEVVLIHKEISPKREVTPDPKQSL